MADTLNVIGGVLVFLFLAGLVGAVAMWAIETWVKEIIRDVRDEEKRPRR